MYSTYNAFRARWTPHGVIKEPTGSNGGEWGVTQDNDGKMWFESGAPGVPVSFQFPIVYGNFDACPTSSSRTSGFPGARRSASPTCRAA